MAPFSFDAKRYPTTPGCYLMQDAAGRILYIGKAKSLRHRLSSYFCTPPRERRIRQLVERVAEIEVILLHSEIEALVLENNLIKQHQPRYNRMLRAEDSGYTYIVLTDEPYPRLAPFRKFRPNLALKGAAEARRFGPYLSSHYRDILLEYVNAVFQLRTCQPLGARLCLRYHLHKCSGICAGQLSPEAYAEAVSQAVAFLSQPHLEIAREMRERMAAHAERLEFEQAQRIRDQVVALDKVLDRQVVERDMDYDQDALYFGAEQVAVISARRGMVQALRCWPLEPGRDGEQFLLTHYARRCPEELLVNALDDPERIAQTLAARCGHSVRILQPTEDTSRALLEIAEMNYRYRTGAS